MAAFLTLFLFSLISHIYCFTAQIPSFSIVLPVTKDVSSLQYTTQILFGTSNVPTKLVLDLGGSSMWAHCTSKSYIHSGSLPCSMAKAGDSGSTSSKLKVNPNGVCEMYPENTIIGMVNSGYLADEIMTFDYLDKLKLDSISTVDRFLFSCTSSLLLKGLASGAKGMLGLGRSRIALTSQLAHSFGLDRKFAICLSSTDGVIYSGGGPYDISKSLVYTPLLSSSQGDSLSDYYINVKSIKVNGKKLSLGQKFIGKAKLSTIVPYTTLEKTLYSIFTKAFIMAATSMNMSRVESVAPFGLCFRSNQVEGTRLEPTVPSIDLVLQSELVKWRINARNSMVHVNDEVMCLGFLDGGSTPKSLIVIGGYQLEDNLLEFNLGTSMLGFSSVLTERNGCSGIRLDSISEGSL